MSGTSLCRLVLLFLPLLLPAAPRRHEVQFRRNDYPVVVAPARLQAAGMAKAILRVFSDDERRGGLYFASGVFPVVRPALAPWAGEYSSGKVPLWAWMGARKFAWLDRQDLLDREWSSGETRPIPKLDLFNPQAQELIVTLFAQLARQRVSGILIQDDLTLQRFEGFSSWGKASFSRASGLAADPRRMLTAGTAQHQAWEDLKTSRVTAMLGRIVAACRQAGPAVGIGLNVHYEAPLTPARARSWYAFDAAAAGASGVDLFYLMAYHRQMQAEMKLGEGDNRLYFRRMLEAALRLWGARLVAKLQVRDWKSSEPIPFTELKTYYDLIPAGVEGVCFAAADPEDLELISRIISE
ncbi:MAG: poly-beta-1,6-N-acetyl-D-glucosamine N-deacetylase PgaB [Acidobacteria bacterium]|jgi:hypothetical protein|nr:poly-beta-1,6-N-acetyl-D-glucosamine N-deacetylase PgaB [Acidobacteriota bacterium]